MNQPTYNIVRDFIKAEGVTHPTDHHIEIRRDVNVRYVTLENSGQRQFGVAIVNYYNGPVPPIRFYIGPGEIRHLGINTQGGPAQFVHILDPETGQPTGNPAIFSRNANEFVIRDGINKTWIHKFYRASYSAAK